MQVSLIQIGNSKGIRIPVKILESLGFKEKIDIEIVEDYGILLKPVNKEPRVNWEKDFQKMHENEDDKLLVRDDVDIDYLAELDW